MSKKYRKYFHSNIFTIEYLRWMRSSKMILFAIMMIYVKSLIVDPLIECSQRMNLKINRLEPMLAIGNSGIVVLMVPLFFLVLMADYPHNGTYDMFVLVRTTKRRWAFSQMLFGIAMSFSVIAVVMAGACVCLGRYGRFSMDYSEAVAQYGSRFPDQQNGYVSQLIPRNIYNQMTFPVAIFYTISLLFLYLVMLSFMYLLFELINKKMIGILVNLCLIFAGTLGCSLNYSWRWIFPMAHAIGWYHWTAFYSKPIFQVAYSYLYFALIILIQAVVIFCVAGGYQNQKGTAYD